MWIKLLMEALKGQVSSKPDDTGSLLGAVRVLRVLKHTVEAQSDLYTQLIHVELDQERQRLTQLLVLVAVAIVGFGCFLLFLGVLILALIWDADYRNWVLAAMVLIYASMAIIAVCKIGGLKRQFGAPFASVREELKADLAVIKSQI